MTKSFAVDVANKRIGLARAHAGLSTQEACDKLNALLLEEEDGASLIMWETKHVLATEGARASFTMDDDHLDFLAETYGVPFEYLCGHGSEDSIMPRRREAVMATREKYK